MSQCRYLRWPSQLMGYDEPRQTVLLRRLLPQSPRRERYYPVLQWKRHGWRYDGETELHLFHWGERVVLAWPDSVEAELLVGILRSCEGWRMVNAYRCLLIHVLLVAKWEKSLFHLNLLYLIAKEDEKQYRFQGNRILEVRAEKIQPGTYMVGSCRVCQRYRPYLLAPSYCFENTEATYPGQAGTDRGRWRKAPAILGCRSRLC
jgi:hypothetical protein